MDPLSIAASIIAIVQLSSKVIGFLNEVKDASKERTQCAVEASNLNSLLFNLRFRLEEGNADASWYTAIRALAVENGPLDQFKHALETLQAGMTGGGRLRKAGEALMWKFKKEEIASILDRMERLKTLVEIALQMDHFKLSQAIKDDTSFVRTHITSIRQDQDHANYSKIVEWISPTDYPAQQSDIIGRKQEGTGQWFLDAPEFVTWLREPNHTLFCPGIPGAGKTMVAAIAIDHLLNSVQSSSIGLAYVYFNYKSREEQYTSSMLAAIVKQLIQARPTIAEPVQRLHMQHADRGTRPSLDEILGALREVLVNYSTVYVVVDALDECRDSDGTRREFLCKLRDLQTGQDLRVMATSRFIPEIEAEFRKATTLEVQTSNEDVRRFVAGQTHRLPKCIQRDFELQVMVQKNIIEAADGMFLLARLHVDSLLDKTTVKKVKTTLTKLSKGSAALDDAYKDAIQRIENQMSGHCELAKKVLAWVTYAKRPLTTTEICCALAVEPDEPELDTENIPDIEDIISVCAGLIVVDQESGIIRLVHYTTQEYLERIGNTWNPDAQLHITSTCLTYLSFDTFKTGSCSSDEEFEERLEENKFLDYAAKHWGKHAVTVEGEVCGLLCSFLSNFKLISSATQALIIRRAKYRGYSQKFPKDSTKLHIVARFGLSIISKAIIPSQGQEKVITLEKRDSDGKSPLHLAAEYGHHGLVKLLLEYGANINAQSRSGNALQAATYGGHEAIIRFLIDNGADVNAQSEKNDNALQVASVRGHGAIVRILLDNGATVNAQGGLYGNALQGAAFRGDEAIVKMLIDNGANVHAQGGLFPNALQAASARGNEAIVRLLINHGADVNAQGGRDGNSLQAASCGGHEATVRLLLDSGADVNAQGGRDGNVLQAASYKGHEGTVKLLIDNGANVNAQGGLYGSVLQGASARGHEAMVRILLDNGADVNAQSGPHSNALLAASYGGCEAIARLLIDRGFDVNAPGQDSHGRSPLHLAARSGHVGTFQYLISLGLNLTTLDAKGDYILSYASSGGSLEVLQAALTYRSTFSSKNIHWSPLHWACRSGKAEIIELLIKNGLRSESVTILEPPGQWSPLDIALFHGNKKMLAELSSSSIALLGSETGSVQSPGKHQRGFLCNGCLHQIYGPCFHCHTCPDLDYCFMCKPFLGSLHTDHEWDYFERDL